MAENQIPQQLDTQSEAKLQKSSAEITAQNLRADIEAAKAPPAPKAKQFKCHNGSSYMLMPGGRKLVFQAGIYVTDRQDEIKFLEDEIYEHKNPYLSDEVVEVEPQKSLAQLRAEWEQEAIEKYIAQAKGASGNAGTSDNKGAGVTATSATASQAAETALQDKLAGLKANTQTQS